MIGEARCDEIKGDLEFSGMCKIPGLGLERWRGRERNGKAKGKKQATYTRRFGGGLVTIKDWVLVSFDAL